MKTKTGMNGLDTDVDRIVGDALYPAAEAATDPMNALYDKDICLVPGSRRRRSAGWRPAGRGSRDMVGNGKDAAIVSTIIGLAGNLGFAVIAEGVETPEQAAALRERGCRQIQGFLVSRPLDPQAFARFAAERLPAAEGE